MLTRSSHSLVSAAVAAGLALTLAACGGSSESAVTLPSDIGLEVDAGPGIRFGKASYIAAAGSVKVAYVNRDTQRHTLVIRDADGVQLPGEMEVAKSGDVEIREYTLEPGNYSLFCNVPGHQAMLSDLVVE